MTIRNPRGDVKDKNIYKISISFVFGKVGGYRYNCPSQGNWEGKSALGH